MNAGRMTAKPNYQAGPKIIRYYIVHFVMEGQAVHWVFRADTPAEVECLERT
jgi:hypothetical protein